MISAVKPGGEGQAVLARVGLTASAVRRLTGQQEPVEAAEVVAAVRLCASPRTPRRKTPEAVQRARWGYLKSAEAAGMNVQDYMRELGLSDAERNRVAVWLRRQKNGVRMRAHEKKHPRQLKMGRPRKEEK